MLVGILSDVHDNLKALESALARLREKGISTIVFCGDFCSPIPARVLGRFAGEIHCVFGNGDGDRAAIQRISHSEHPNLIVYGEHLEIEIAGRRVAATHYPLYGQALARTGDYDAVFSGHTHESSTEMFDRTLWHNPGEILGWKGPPTYSIWDTTANTTQLEQLDTL